MLWPGRIRARAHLWPNLQFPFTNQAQTSFCCPGSRMECEKGQEEPAVQEPTLKNLHGTWERSLAGRAGADQRLGRGESRMERAHALRSPLTWGPFRALYLCHGHVRVRRGRCRCSYLRRAWLTARKQNERIKEREKRDGECAGCETRNAALGAVFERPGREEEARRGEGWTRWLASLGRLAPRPVAHT